MLPPLVASSISSFEFSRLILPPLVLPSTLPPTLSRSRLPPLVENFRLPDKFVRLILPPLVDRSVETFLGTNTLKEMFSAFFQSVIFSLSLAVAVTLLFATETFRLYFSFNLCWISSLVSSLLLFEVIYTSTRASVAATPETEILPPDVSTSTSLIDSLLNDFVMNGLSDDFTCAFTENWKAARRKNNRYFFIGFIFYL